MLGRLSVKSKKYLGFADGSQRTSHRGLTYHVRSAHQNNNTLPGVARASNGGLGGLHAPSSPCSDHDSNHSESFTPPPQPSPSPHLRPQSQKNYHPFLNGRPCNEAGEFLPDGTPPPPRTTAADDDWSPYEDSVQFNITDFLFHRVQMSTKNIDNLLEQWALSLMKHGDLGPFENYQHLYETIDATKLYAPVWARQSYEIWYRDPEVVISNMLDNPDFDGAFDTAPYVHLDSNGKRRWHDFMSANFAWRHSDKIYDDDHTTEGSMYTPLFFGIDKTTVSVATGNVEYHPGYISLRNLHNSIRGGHRNGVVPFVFLAIPKSDRKYDNDPEFRGMTTPVVRRCPDGHFRRIIYDFGPFIADYPEQVMLAGIVQNCGATCTAMANDLDAAFAGRRTNALTDILLAGFPADILWDEYGIDVDIVVADIHEMLSLDLLHQIIKGSFKDHLVTWFNIVIFMCLFHIIAAVPAFPGLRRFKQGRRFKQWTGDDSKALMKGLVPPQIVEALGAFVDFCYLVRRSDFDEDTLDAIDASVANYHERREIFRDLRVRPDGFSIPRQHAMVHYRPNIEKFGAPGGVCSSITESHHITAIKKPWRRSSRYETLSQMLLTNQRLDKLSAARANFVERGMVPPNFTTVPDKIVEDANVEETDEQRSPRISRSSWRLPSRPALSPNYPNYGDVSEQRSRHFRIPHLVYYSAVATFYAPSDPSGIRGMRRERIRSTPTWRKHGPRRDCVFVVENQGERGFRGMSVPRVRLLFSFTHDGIDYPCALVDWFKKVGRSPDSETGMWIVEPEMKGCVRLTTIVHIDTLLRGAHLIPVYGSGYISTGFRYTYSLDAFKSFHVNKYIDHHANEIAF
ncbi:hypothetical protein DFH08DRAFT_916752 [Mycena albidolilacea]|uniref:Uncharacterized protein n=1 Tax=Mycena albidolilacea TaxID=1033008 RepID=A0AAD6ZLI7_9AGAR|nr:hypothetical protein DFH08DRAFT_916752 [Mycena albidolilacea]